MAHPLFVRALLIFFATLSAGILYWSTFTGFGIPDFASDLRRTEGTVLFVGDVMLSRHVEQRMREFGTAYPFKYVQKLLKSRDYVVGNFEGSIPTTHVPTPAFGMRFSVDATFTPALADAGFTTMTLANNHAFDYGANGFAGAKKALSSAGMHVAGDPGRVTPDDIAILDVRGVDVAVIPIHAVMPINDIESVLKTIRDTGRESDVQIVSIHWGDEYDLHSNDYQQSLARAFVDAGADAIIGHHPHVTQEIEMYQGVPIFYSLGNFVFDQYWNEDVQESLAVTLKIGENRLSYELTPIRSESSVPYPMSGTEKKEFLAALADRSDVYLAPAIKDGVFSFDMATLASSGETAMIGGY